MKKTLDLNLKAKQQACHLGRLIPLAKWNKFHADPSVASLRYLYFTNRDGFRKCVLKRGNRLIISESLYLKWLGKQNQETFDEISTDGAMEFDWIPPDVLKSLAEEMRSDEEEK